MACVSVVIILLVALQLVNAWVLLQSAHDAKKWGVATTQLADNGKSSSQDEDIARLKTEILKLGAALDRGQAYNPTSGSYYKEQMEFAKGKVQSLIRIGNKLPTSLRDIAGEWELVFSSVPHGIFRSSPFFLAIQEAYTQAGAPEKAQLFFKLHELQTCSWGISKVGKVAQVVDADRGVLVSEFDTSLFSLTTIPLLGWFKLLPTFGGTVVTVSNASLAGEGVLRLEVDYTTARPVPGLPGLGDFIWGQKVPVSAIWKRLPWNGGRPPTATIRVRYIDEDFRVMEDSDGELFVYTRPVFTSSDLDKANAPMGRP
eukprot:gene36883-44746_t